LTRFDQERPDMADIYVPLLILAVWGVLATIYLAWRAWHLPKLDDQPQLDDEA
jgi:hypothetical protein